MSRPKIQSKTKSTWTASCAFLVLFNRQVRPTSRAQEKLVCSRNQTQANSYRNCVSVKTLDFNEKLRRHYSIRLLSWPPRVDPP